MEDLKRHAFQTALQMRADAAEASFPPPTDEHGRSAHNKGRRPRTVLTRNGRVAVNRRHYYLAGRGSVQPIDICLGLGDGTAGSGLCISSGDG